MVLRNSFIYMVGQGLSSGISLVLLTLYTKYLSPREFGIGALILITITFGTIIFGFGLNTGYMAKYYKLSESQRKEAFSVVAILFTLILPVSIVIIPFGAKLAHSFENGFSEKQIALGVLTVFFGLFYQFFLSLLQVQMRAVHFVLYSVGYGIVVGILNLYFIVVQESSYMSFLYSLLVSNFLGMIVGAVCFRRHFVKVDKVRFKSTLNYLVRVAWPVLPSQIGVALMTSGDRYVLNYLAGGNAVGIYSVGHRFGSLVQGLLVIPFFNAYNPVAYQLFVKDRARFKVFQKDSLVIFVLILSTVLVCASVFFEFLFKTFVDQRYWSGYGLIGIIAGAYFLEGMAFLFDAVQTMFEKLEYSLYRILVSSVVSLGLNLLLIPRFGIEGAAMASLGGYFLIFVLSYVLNQRLLKIDYGMAKPIGLLLLCFAAIFVQHRIPASDLGTALLIRGSIATGCLAIFFFLNRSLVRGFIGRLQFSSQTGNLWKKWILPER